MSSYVVDASVVTKWFLTEVHVAAARRVRDCGRVFLVPDLLLPELANVLVKAQRRGDIDAADMLAIMGEVRSATSISDTRDLIDTCISIALRYQRSAYDALYVALAAREACPLVTADRRLYDAIAPSLPQTMLWVEDVP